MKTLEQRRDELAEEYGAKACQTDGVKLVGNIMEIVSRESFDAAVAELRPEIEKLVAALEPFELATKDRDFEIDETDWGFCFSGKEWREFKNALTNFKAFMGDGE